MRGAWQKDILCTEHGSDSLYTYRTTGEDRADWAVLRTGASQQANDDRLTTLSDLALDHSLCGRPGPDVPTVKKAPSSSSVSESGSFVATTLMFPE